MKYAIPKSKKLWLPILIVVLILQSVLLLFQLDRTNILWSQVQGPPSEKKDTFNLNSMRGLQTQVLIQQAIQGLYKNSGVIDAKENRVYFPELKIYLPLSQETRDLRYLYDQPLDGEPEYISLNHVNVMGRLVSSFDDVPCLQRIAAVTIGKSSSLSGQFEKEAGNLQLADGRTLHFRTNESDETKKCSDFWGENSPDKIVDTLKQAQSY